MLPNQSKKSVDTQFSLTAQKNQKKRMKRKIFFARFFLCSKDHVLNRNYLKEKLNFFRIDKTL